MMNRLMAIAVILACFQVNATTGVLCDSIAFDKALCEQVKQSFSTRSSARVVATTPDKYQVLLLEQEYLWILNLNFNSFRLITRLPKDAEVYWSSLDDSFIVHSIENKTTNLYRLEKDATRLRRVVKAEDYLVRANK